MDRYYYLKTLEDGKIIEIRSESETLDSLGLIEISVEEFNKAHCYKYFNVETREFLEAIEENLVTAENTIDEILTLTSSVDQATRLVSDDTLLNMELICGIDEKLNTIMAHLGLNS